MSWLFAASTEPASCPVRIRLMSARPAGVLLRLDLGGSLRGRPSLDLDFLHLVGEGLLVVLDDHPGRGKVAAIVEDGDGDGLLGRGRTQHPAEGEPQYHERHHDENPNDFPAMMLHDPPPAGCCWRCGFHGSGWCQVTRVDEHRPCYLDPQRQVKGTFNKHTPSDQRIILWSATRGSAGTDFNNNSRAVQGGIGFAGNPPNPNNL